jgi:AcrR family transcriptional regulator
VLPSTRTRRQEYAAATRAAIIQAGRELFAERGFFAVRVEEIAKRARVAPATVYTSVGGKHAILLELIEQLSSWQPRQATFEAIACADTSHEILVALARGTRETREHWGDVLRVITETAPHDDEARQAQDTRLTRYRDALRGVLERLTTVEGSALDAEAAFATLWFYFGPTSYVPLHDDLNWSYARTEKWLLKQCEHALGLT